MTTETDRILIVRLGALGDILHALPAQQAIAACLPDREVHWLTERSFAPLLNCVPGIRRVWTVETKHWRKHPSGLWAIVPLLRQLRKQRFRLAFDFQGLVKSALLARLARPERLVGFLPERFKERGIDWLYDDAKAGEADLTRHVIESNLGLVASVLEGIDPSPSALVPFQLPEEDRHYVDQQLRRLKAVAPIVINPGAGWVTKLWPAHQYGELGLRIEDRLGMPVIYSFGPGEDNLLQQVRASWGKRPVKTFPSTVLQLARLFQQSTLVVAGDSGPLHLAVACGTPTVAILGPTSPRRNGPFAEDEVVRRDLPCSNSYRRTCREFICMDIPVDTVFEAVERRLGRLRSKATKPDLVRGESG